MVDMNYISVPQLRAAVKDPSLLDQTAMELAIAAASRTVDGYCGRHFYQHDSIQYYTGLSSDPWWLDLGDMDLATKSGLTVQIGWSGNGTYPDTWVVDVDFICEPVNQSVNGIEGWSFTALRSVTGKVWPPRTTSYQHSTIKITGTWGWPAIPAAVQQATTVLAAFMYKRPEAALGTVGMAEWGMMRVQEPDVSAVLKPYKKGASLLIA